MPAQNHPLHTARPRNRNTAYGRRRAGSPTDFIPWVMAISPPVLPRIKTASPMMIRIAPPPHWVLPLFVVSSGQLKQLRHKSGRRRTTGAEKLIHAGKLLPEK